jgi:hypothetical protein
MVNQDVLAANGIEHGIRVMAYAHLAWHERRILQIGPANAEYQGLVQLERRYQAADDIRMRVVLDLQSHRFTLAPQRHLRVDRL